MSDIRKDYVKEFSAKEHFGMITMIDAKSCNEFVSLENKLMTFTIALSDIIDMKRFGDCNIIHFGNDPAVEGYSIVQRGRNINQLTQLIETSLIAGHFVDKSNDAYIDVFSCKCYDPYLVRDFVKMYFKPAQIVMNVVNRG